MTTTLNAIRSYRPCVTGWAKLLAYLGKTTADDEPLSLLTVLESNGLDDAVWCLRTEPTPERIRRFALAIASRIEHLSAAAKACNDTTERCLNGLMTEEELRAAANAAAYAAKAAYAARAAYAAANAAYAAANAAYAANAANAANAAANAAYAANAAAYAAAYAAKAAKAAYAAERQAQEQLFREIFA
jgi:chemotaxis protein histidine kinase CheA